jgi:type IV secretory pathway VirB6-like protein
MDKLEPEKSDVTAEASVIKTPGKTTLICALVLSLGPLVVGVSIFLLWLLTRSPMLEVLGLLTIWGGFFSVLLALAAVIAYISEAIMAKERAGKIVLRAMIVLIAIIINFPAALACIAGSNYISSFYVLTVENRSSVPIQQVTISGGGITRNVGPILPGGKDRVKFRITSKDSLTFSASSNGLKIDGVLEDYITPRSGANRTLAIMDGGKYVVEGLPPFVD